MRFLVPMFGLIEAPDPIDAAVTAHRLLMPHPWLHVDEGIEPIPFDPASIEPHTVFDVMPPIVAVIEQAEGLLSEDTDDDMQEAVAHLRALLALKMKRH